MDVAVILSSMNKVSTNMSQDNRDGGGGEERRCEGTLSFVGVED